MSKNNKTKATSEDIKTYKQLENKLSEACSNNDSCAIEELSLQLQELEDRLDWFPTVTHRCQGWQNRLF